jgi:hypothetical protein
MLESMNSIFIRKVNLSFFLIIEAFFFISNYKTIKADYFLSLTSFTESLAFKKLFIKKNFQIIIRKIATLCRQKCGV